MILGRLLPIVLLACWPLRALAARPFDQTDADVAKPGELELELGPAQFLHEPGRNALLPGFALNVGVAHGLEAVLDLQSDVRLGNVPAGEDRWSLEPALLLKAVLREGSLQEQGGPSVALEAGVLLPRVPSLAGTGGSLALVGSQRWWVATVHLNVMAERSREGTVDLVTGAILEGPMGWTVCPVTEAWIGRVEDGLAASLLGGVLWRAREGLSFDGAVRVSPVPDRPAVEVRLGLTWAIRG